MEYKDYYKILGVNRDASETEIKQAYRKLARQYHPDVNPGDKQAETRFKDINEAYQVLSDKEKRGKYDHFGQDWQHYQQSGGPPPGAGGMHWNVYTSGAGGSSAFSDFFEALFGGVGGGGARFRSMGGMGGMGGFDPAGGFGPGTGGMGGIPRQDVEQPIDVTLEEAFAGTQRKLQLTSGGSTRTITIKIPVGVDTGTRVRVAGEGNPIAGSNRRGDLFLIVNLTPHDRFERNGTDLNASVAVDLYTMLLGGEARIPTIDGKTLTLNVPPETPNGKVFRLNGQGMPHLNQPTHRGALYVTITAELPAALSPREKDLLARLRDMRA